MKFTRLSPGDFPRLVPYFTGLRYELCSYSLTTILVWDNPLHHPHGAEENGVLYIRSGFAGRGKKNFLFLPVCPDREFSPSELAKAAARAGVDRVGFVPGDWLDRQGRDKVKRLFSVRSMAGYHDYLYPTQDLAQLPGNRYHKKKNLVRQFEKAYIRPGRARVEPMGPDNRDECLEFLDQWCAERDCGASPESSMACEKIAATNSLKNMEVLAARGIAVRVDGQVSAFAMATRITDQVGDLNFEKAFAGIKGLYQYLDRESARTILAPFAWTNKESDMGLPGLRQAKLSYLPARMVRSYSLVLKN
ncbi:MAG: DUF2156 domain-containing protein [Proteobacteria bacterium]|nr:DUF2156 domain-containing protein [Pseudomonadota bacterium]